MTQAAEKYRRAQRLGEAFYAAKEMLPKGWKGPSLLVDEDLGGWYALALDELYTIGGPTRPTPTKALQGFIEILPDALRSEV